MIEYNIPPSIDETISQVKLKPMHWRIWILSACGMWMGGFSLFVIGIILPLIKQQNHITPLKEGLLGASVIIGTVIGSLVFGRMADIYGRKKILLVGAAIISLFSILAGFALNINMLICILIMIGIGIGADYPICASYIAELMPSRIRGKMLIGAFSFQAMGILTAAIVGFITLNLCPHDYAWKYIITFCSLPAMIIFIFRIYIPESPRWCVLHGKFRKAMRIISQLSMKTDKQIYEIVRFEKQKMQERIEQALPITSMFKSEYISKTILSSVPWFLMDISLYGIGIFTPTIISSIILNYFSHPTTIIQTDIISTIISALVYTFLILGFAINILLIDKIGRIKLQLFGFIGMFLGLCIISLSVYDYAFTVSPYCRIIMTLIGFTLYNLLINAGPNATTFILPAELFPTKLRATAHGFSTSIAKIGAIIGIVLLPILHAKIGLFYTILTISITALLGFIITLIFRVETIGKSLDELSRLEVARTMGQMKKYK